MPQYFISALARRRARNDTHSADFAMPWLLTTSSRKVEYRITKCQLFSAGRATYRDIVAELRRQRELPQEAPHISLFRPRLRIITLWPLH